MADLRRTHSMLDSPLFLLAAGALVLLGGIQHAHAQISVADDGTHKSRSSDDGLKDSPCGTTGSTRGTEVYTYKPGATINLSIVETISRPGYFRIAFDSDGDDGFVIPSGTRRAVRRAQ